MLPRAHRGLVWGLLGLLLIARVHPARAQDAPASSMPTPPAQAASAPAADAAAQRAQPESVSAAPQAALAPAAESAPASAAQTIPASAAQTAPSPAAQAAPEAAKRPRGERWSPGRLRERIAADESVVKAAREEFRSARKAELALIEKMVGLLSEESPPAELRSLRIQVDEARRRRVEAGERLEELERNLEELRLRAGALGLSESPPGDPAGAPAERRAAPTAADVSPVEVEDSPRSASPGVVLGIAAAAVLLWWIGWAGRRRIREMLDRRGRAAGGEAARESRASRIVDAGWKLLQAAIAVVAAILILAELGLVGGGFLTGVLALLIIVAFLLRDPISDYARGVMLVLAPPFEVNDVVRIGSVTGVVESIGARFTAVRDFSGAVHHVRSGDLRSVSSLSRSWSRAVVDVAVSYDEDVDRVLDILRQETAALRSEGELRDVLSGNPEVIGVDRFDDAGAILRVSLKTAPLRESEVREELGRRIDARLGEQDLAARIIALGGAPASA